jgi:hypothetical protein
VALPEDRRIPEEKFPEKVRRFIAADAPPQLRMMCARGMVPMPPVVQVSALCHLAALGDAELAQAAGGTLRNQPRNVMVGVAKEPLLPVVLDWLADVFADADDVLESVIVNKMADDDTVARIARKGNERVTEAVALNQARLARSAAIVEALYYNPSTRASTADRVVDFAARSGLDLSHLPGFDAVLAAITGEQTQAKSAEDAAKADQAYREAKRAVESLVEKAGDEEQLLDSLAELDEQPESEATKEKKSAAGRIRDLTVPQKVRLALMGSKAERAILIKDSNKLVSRAVITSPALSDTEVMSFASNKGLPDEILAYIAKNKNWTRHYKVRLNLVTNPRTPVGFAMNFLRQLRASDLRGVARSKNVSGAISRAAKEMIKAKN